MAAAPRRGGNNITKIFLYIKIICNFRYQTRTGQLDVDSLPFLWRHYAPQPGCASLYSEDYPAINTFNYYRPGFTHPPTHIYHRCGKYLLTAPKIFSVQTVLAGDGPVRLPGRG